MRGELSLSTLIDVLESDSPVMTPTRMEEILKRLVLGKQEIETYALFSDRRYARNLVYKNPAFEVMVMCWKNGQRSSIHDHSGSLGGLKILENELTECLFERAPNGMIRSLSSDLRMRSSKSPVRPR